MTSALSLIHGWGMTPAIWQPIATRLREHQAVNCPALPGHGDAPAAAPERWVDVLIDQLPDDGVLCGWSLGGQLALEIAHRAPHKCRRLILIATSPRFVAGGDWPHALDTTTVDGFIDGFDADPVATMKRFVALQALGDATRRVLTRQLTGALAPIGTAGARGLADGLRRLADTDLRPILAEITCPVRILHGAGDALMPMAGAIAMADALPNARFSAFDDCGHAPFLSREADCAALIQGFIDD
jgi:pimeloyl-[acyl-carrier protein] methyl ester esterase